MSGSREEIELRERKRWVLYYTTEVMLHWDEGIELSKINFKHRHLTSHYKPNPTSTARKRTQNSELLATASITIQNESQYQHFSPPLRNCAKCGVGRLFGNFLIEWLPTFDANKIFDMVFTYPHTRSSAGWMPRKGKRGKLECCGCYTAAEAWLGDYKSFDKKDTWDQSVICFSLYWIRTKASGDLGCRWCESELRGTRLVVSQIWKG